MNGILITDNCNCGRDDMRNRNAIRFVLPARLCGSHGCNHHYCDRWLLFSAVDCLIKWYSLHIWKSFCMISLKNRRESVCVPDYNFQKLILNLFYSQFKTIFTIEEDINKPVPHLILKIFVVHYIELATLWNSPSFDMFFEENDKSSRVFHKLFSF